MKPPLFVDATPGWALVKAPQRPNTPDPGPYPFAFGAQTFIPTAGSRIGAQTDVPVYVMVDNVEADAVLRGEVRSSDGRSIPSAAFQVLKSEPAGKGTRVFLCSLRPEGLARGRYSLMVMARKGEKEAQGVSSFEVP